ncbi:hypothetical protein E2C01_049741 [Portunus trituberculatus]|uniref:Uncharacterized protein n=1 Tax=Portunus trituberculatus TaxID=210409 RepID=A0A5B7GEM5_PORTR|nr:hypothetical protein [Portunus trituberculatus]
MNPSPFARIAPGTTEPNNSAYVTPAEVPEDILRKVTLAHKASFRYNLGSYS